MNRIVLFILNLIIISSVAKAQRTLGQIYGEVYNIEEAAIADANVKIRELNKITYTDVNGKFLFSNIPRGRYHLEITGAGFVKEILHVELRYEKEVRLIAVLVKADERLEDVEVFGERNIHLAPCSLG